MKYALPENSYEELESLTRDAERTILQKLGLHYRVVTLFDWRSRIRFGEDLRHRSWLPSQNTFREISSCSNYEAFQARRAQIRFRRAGGAQSRSLSIHSTAPASRLDVRGLRYWRTISRRRIRDRPGSVATLHGRNREN